MGEDECIAYAEKEGVTIAKQPFHVMAKPTGPICNLKCDYCFYLHKKELYTDSKNFRMSDELLERFICEYIHNHPGPEVPFAWQGGEPTLMGVDFFRKVVQLQKRYIPKGWSYTNALQTNGTLIDQEWAQFLKEEEFLVGLSLDGPEELHNMFRQDAKENGTWHRVVEAFHLLRSFDVVVNILCVVNAFNGSRPRELYYFFKELGADYLQFIPLVEQSEDGQVSERSVTGPLYGNFLITLFNEWLQDGLGTIVIQIFEEAFRAVAGFPPSLCIFSKECGNQVIIEHNGDIYSCDHFVTHDYFLGNIMEKNISELITNDIQREFSYKKSTLPDQCLVCPVLNMCNGGCPKNRIPTSDGPTLNWLCEGYRQFFLYTKPFLQEILKTLKNGRMAVEARPILLEQLEATWDVSRNDPCPCLSGLKYKKCCGK